MSSTGAAGRGLTAGFSLLEVLVALVVVAVALGALLASMGRFADNAAGLRERTLAQWVALNLVTEARIMRAWPAPAETSGEEDLGGHRWYWIQRVATTPDPRLRRLEVLVRAVRDAEHPVVTVEAYLGEP
ncbi:MAG: type II secretion system minor pseudopilin GspI [Magnetococcus sp. WYHC-3]